MIGFTDILLETALDDVQRDYVETVKRSGATLLALINDILDFSKIEAEKMDLEEIDFDPEVLAFDVCDLIKAPMAEKPIELLCSVDDELPAQLIGDPAINATMGIRAGAVLFHQTGSYCRQTISDCLNKALASPSRRPLREQAVDQ